MSKIEEFEKDLKVAYLNYENNNLQETLKYLDRILTYILENDENLKNDPFWKALSCDVFKASVLNIFYNKKELTGNDLYSLLENEEKAKNNIKEFCEKFKDNELIDFTGHIDNISGKPLEDAIKILIVNLRKMSIANIPEMSNKGIHTLEQTPWVPYLDIDEITGERKLRDDTPEEIKAKYNEYLQHKTTSNNVMPK